MLKRSWVNLVLVFLPLVAGVVEFVLINIWAQALPPFMVTADFGVFALVFGMTIRNLGVIASSPTDLEPVLTAILDSAIRLCDASAGTIWRRDGDTLVNVMARVPAPPGEVGLRTSLRSRDWSATGSRGRV